MSYGFSAINNLGTTVIDHDYSNYALHSQLSITSGVIDPDWWDTGEYRVINVYIPNIDGIVVFTDSPYSIFTMNGISAGATIEIWYSNPYDPTGTYPLTSWEFKLYFFVPSTVLSIPSGYGLNIYNSSSSLVFSSGYDYIKHLQTFIVDTSQFSLETTFSNKTNGKLIFNLNPFRVQGSYWYQYEGGLYYSGNISCEAYINNNTTFMAGADAFWAHQQVSSAGMGSAFSYWNPHEQIYVGEINV